MIWFEYFINIKIIYKNLSIQYKRSRRASVRRLQKRSFGLTVAIIIRYYFLIWFISENSLRLIKKKSVQETVQVARESTVTERELAIVRAAEAQRGKHGQRHLHWRNGDRVKYILCVCVGVFFSWNAENVSSQNRQNERPS